MARKRSADYGERARRALLAAAKILAFDPANVREMADALEGAPRRRNPAHLHAPVADSHLEEVSARFHGTPTETAVLDDDQRRPPPREVVVIGEEVAVAYRPDGHSQRGGVVWEHEVGDAGDGRPRKRGKRYLVTDGQEVWSVPGTNRAEFDPDRGLVG